MIETRPTEELWEHYPYHRNRRVISMIPTEPGWRVVEYVDGATADDPVEDMFYVMPVLAWVCVESIRASRGRDFDVQPVVADDHPPYPRIYDDDEAAFAGLLAPGAKLDGFWRESGLRMIEAK